MSSLFRMVSISALLVCMPCREALAQRAWVIGTVVDSLGSPLAYANIIIKNSTFGAMTDEMGAFRMEIPPGRHIVRALMMGRMPAEQSVEVDNARTVSIVFSLVQDDRRGRQTLVDVSPSVASVAEDQLESVPVVPVYVPRTKPIRSGPLELTLRYFQSQDGDSVRTTIVAEGTNVTNKLVSVCGCFSFWKVGYGLGPELCDSIPLGGHWQYRGPTLDVKAAECAAGALECPPTQLKPGATFSREMKFTFRAMDFEKWPGQVNVTCIYFQGQTGAAWADTEHVMLTPTPFAVPVRPLDKPYHPR